MQLFEETGLSLFIFCQRFWEIGTQEVTSNRYRELGLFVADGGRSQSSLTGGLRLKISQMLLKLLVTAKREKTTKTLIIQSMWATCRARIAIEAAMTERHIY